MANIKEMVEDENKIGTVIADDIAFKGTLKFKNSLKIKGTFEGRIESDGQLIIGREAAVSADVKAGEVLVSGTVAGKIKASHRIEMYRKSRVSADVVTPELIMESGSLLNGTCIMNEKNPPVG